MDVNENSSESQSSFLKTDSALAPVSAEERQHWIVPTMIFGGLEFCIPIIMIGSVLSADFSFWELISILLISLIVIQWPGNAIQGYIGAKTGLASSVLAQQSFGLTQSRYVIGLIIALMNMGWWAIQTSVVSNAVSVMFGIDYNTELFAWILITIVVGLLFALPSVIGYSSMKWTDYFAVPAGLLVVGICLYLAFQNIGWSKISTWQPEGGMRFNEAINLVLSMNVAQWVIASDYTRYARPRIKDNLIIPLGIIGIGFPLIMVGVVMSIGVGNPDIVDVMVNLGFPTWGFLLLWFATWTSQLVANYSGGLAMCHVAGVRSGRGRSLLTLLMAGFGILLALVGILEHFTVFLNVIAMLLPGIAGVMMFDYFLFKGKNRPTDKWNLKATVSMGMGILVAFLTQYTFQFGIPILQSFVVTGVAYVILNKGLATVPQSTDK